MANKDTKKPAAMTAEQFINHPDTVEVERYYSSRIYTHKGQWAYVSFLYNVPQTVTLHDTYEKAMPFTWWKAAKK
jgi:hypothetical protein